MIYATASLCRVPVKDLPLFFLYLLLIGFVAPAEAFHHEADTPQNQTHDQCPAGQYLQKASPPNTAAGCKLCDSGVNFTEYPNELPSCIPCRICRPDQEEVMPCNTTRNTQCHCKAGTFCPKDHPCEICNKCKSKCPEGMVEVSSCSPWSDLKCAYSQPSDTRNFWIRISLLIVTIVVVPVLVIFFWYKCCNVSEAGNLSPRNPLDFKNGYHPQHPKAQDNEDVKQNDLQGKADSPENQGDEPQVLLTEVITVPGTSMQNGCHLGQTKAMASQVDPKSLFPVDGDHIKTLEKSFFIFEEMVPWESWNQYMRQLGLSQNEILQARASESSVKDHPHSLLMTWLNKTGKVATVGFLLETLEKIHQRAAREIIQDKLISNGLYDYQKREDDKPN
ncbi:tumor necrosis factor receptor superfamily member 10A-like isoform X2 [Petaurus breviceps papuanus]|uniref:tumor necrosis factor receptor superfamily member 10A-like isoform X2 n=1 Tax=Petaurus breviceps papuanus TaxID=3040969 RepID=UPI0036DE3828